MNLKCELIVNSDVEHLRQIYTGFNLLHAQGFLQLKQTIPNEFLQDKTDGDRWTNYKFFNTKVILNEKTTVIYDTHDWNWIDEEILSEADFYFKRSYDENFVSQLEEGNKVFPLGLNYQVTSREKDFFQVQRAAFYSGKDRIKAFIKGLHLGKGETEQLVNMESYPQFDLPPKVLFMARAWDTNLIENKTGKEAVEQINETRAECIRRLRKEFGMNFFGGLAHEDYAVKNFKDCLLPDGNLSNKRKYLEILKDFPICIATTGLNGSNGWKLGEYVAFSKAIVTEPLQFKVTGDFKKEANYLEFAAPEEVVKSVARLFEDEKLRLAMMMNNFKYYQSYVKPDALVLNSLLTVFQNAGLT
jgi:hypothetical protein